MTTWYLQPVMGSYVLVLVVALALVVLLFLRPSFGQLSVPRRLALVALRALLVLALVAALVQPACVSTTTKRQPTTFAIATDVSRSVNQPLESSGGGSRYDAEKAALARIEDELRRLPAEIEVKAFVYDVEPREQEIEGGRFVWPEKAAGAQTDIGGSLSEVIARLRGQRLAGVLLLGDGAQTAYSPKVESQEAARELARLGCPLYTVTFGPPRDKVQAKDVAIASLPEQFTVFVNTELTVKALVQVNGYANQELPVELVLEDSTGAKQTIGAKRVRAREDGQQVPVEFTYVPTKVGQYQLVVRATEQPGEATTVNNHMSAYLTVMEGGLRILYLSGELWGEQLRLRRALDASNDMQVDFQWIDHRARAGWPVDLSKLLGDNKYDVYILENVNAAALGPKQIEQLAAAVEQGKALLMIGGEHSFGAGSYFGTPLADVLPIVMGRLERQDFGVPVRQDLHIAGPLPLLPTGNDFLTRLAPGAENEKIWRKLPPLEGANKFASVKDRAHVMLQSPGGEPILVAGEAVGRVIAFAGDSTWRWWGQGFQNEHKRFWRQVVLWLVRREEEEKTSVWLQLAARRLNAGQRLTFTGGARTTSGEPVAAADYKARVKFPDGKSAELALSVNGAERRGAFENTSQAGRYEIEFTATKNGKSLGASKKEFEVVDTNPEDSTLAADPDHFARLANMTREFGGKALAPEQLPELIDWLRQHPPDTEVEVITKWELAGAWTDAWGLFLLFVGLLTAEWFLRKKWGLV